MNVPTSDSDQSSSPTRQTVEKRTESPIFDSPWIEAPDPTLIQNAIARFVADSLPPVSMGLGALYLLFAIAHFVLQPTALSQIMTPVAAITSLMLLGLAIHWQRGPVPLPPAHAYAAFCGALVLLNSWLHLWLSVDPQQSTNFMLLIVGVGFFFLSSYWFAGFVVTILLIWGATVSLLNFPPEVNTHFGFGLASATLLATLAHFARKRTLMRLSLLRLRDAERAKALQQALELGKESEEALRRSETNYRQLSIRLEEQAEALRLANEELERAAKLKDEFLANMSHELRTPLTVILGLTESLLETIYGPLTERQLAVINNVFESGQHLLALINDILDVAKLETGHFQLELVPTDAQMIAEAGLRFIQPEAEKKKLTVHFEHGDVVKSFLADERRIKQMLINLLSNAVKFTNEEGHIGLHLESDPMNRIVRYTVWDTGIGIDGEQMAQLFEPFVQLDSRLSRRYSGSGLGLVLTYRMADLHGGSIMVQSQPGQGSRFTIALPWRNVARQKPPAHVQEPPHQTAPQPRPSILIVDKHSATRTWIEELLTESTSAAPYDILPTSAPADALHLAYETQPIFIFIDLRLGKHESLALIRTMAVDQKLTRCSIVALSALDRPSTKAEALAAGAAHYICKPIGKEVLQRLLATTAVAP